MAVDWGVGVGVGAREVMAARVMRSVMAVNNYFCTEIKISHTFGGNEGERGFA
jgi:hypothetical protein